MTAISVTVNGRPHTAQVEPRRLLVDFLREDLGLVGTHIGCEHGVCGTCTVLLDGEPVNSCLVFALQVDGCSVTTVRGLTGDSELHPLQRAFVDNDVAQCGFCTPGMILTANWFIDRQPHANREEIRTALAGNLCRCTGYTKILDAVEAYRDSLLENGGGNGD